MSDTEAKYSRAYPCKGAPGEELEDVISSMPEHTIQMAAIKLDDCWEVTYIVPIQPKEEE